MTKAKSTKRVLISALLALVMTVAMLVGTTFAWFTDSVTSAGNKIVAGNLDIQLQIYNGTEYTDISNSDKPIFGSNGLAAAADGSSTLWEPGKTQVAYLAIKNAGSLSLKYKVVLDVTQMSEGLDEVLKYSIFPDAKAGDVSSWADASTVSSVVGGQQLVSADGVSMSSGDVHYFALAVHMDELAGNEHMDSSVTFDLSVLATQEISEEDSFGSGYDAGATYPAIAAGSFSSANGEDLYLEVGKVGVTVPKTAEDGVYKLQVDLLEETTNDAGNEVVKYEITLTRNGESVNGDGTVFTVTIDVKKMATIDKVLHNGVEMTASDYTYDPISGVITITTSTFSPFEVHYTSFSDNFEIVEPEVEGESAKIVGGIFKGVNPATLDPSLLEENSEYVAVDFVKDGVKYYAVSERATTVIVGGEGSATALDFENANANSLEPKSAQSGKLYSVISGLQGNAYSTVYLLPGTYNEATTINVYSNMTIMGLGDAEDIKLIKVKGSYSNRHLINVNGAVTRDEHIQVEIRNLYLDASAKNLNSAGKFYLTDNAAVQSIRLSKVKCYDLEIVKSSGFAFYVNGKYDARGAFLYAENCSMTTSSVVDTASTYRFFYNNLTYKNGAYATNSSYIKNVAMENGDWDWLD